MHVATGRSQTSHLDKCYPFQSQLLPQIFVVLTLVVHLVGLVEVKNAETIMRTVDAVYKKWLNV